MRKVDHQLDNIKNYVRTLEGKDLRIVINKGRKKIVRYFGCIDEVYPQIFTIRITGEPCVEKLSFSYNDVICGDITLCER